jgi:N-acetylglucosaminyldiphosphoundecaprenol N-acetyl-beta-D-mannosaminyltransferase
MPVSAPPQREGHSCRRGFPAATLTGVRIDAVDRAQLRDAVESFIECGRRNRSSHVVHFCAAHPTVVARTDDRYRAVLNDGDLNVPDGAPVAFGLRLHGLAVRRIPGTDALGAISRWGVEREVSHFFFGSTQDVLRQLRGNVERADPGIRIAGTMSPPFRPLAEDELRETAARIRRTGADALWVGLGSPKQDVVAAALRTFEAAPVILCVGAAFDFIAGTKRRAPAWMQRSGLEWLHRLASEPRRLWRRYLIGNPRFVAGLVVDWVRGPVRSEP